MKQYLLIASLAMPLVVVGQGNSPQTDPCGTGGCTDTLSYTIKNDQGAVIDQTEYDRDVGLPYAEVMVLKYIRLLRCTGNETNTFIDVLDAGGDAAAFRQILDAEKAK